MKIAISADCFNAYTSGFPVRGMTLELIKNRKQDHFVLFYTKRELPQQLKSFYDEINSLPNVEVKFFKYSRRIIAIKRLLCLSYVKLDESFDCFINPGYVEFIKGYKGKTICSHTDLSAVKGFYSGEHAWFFKYWRHFHLKYTLPLIDTIVTISEYTRQDIYQYFPSLNKEITVIHNGIATFWLDDIYSENDVVKKFEMQTYFIWWGFISRRKNIDNLISAYKLAKNNKPDLPRLLLVGGIAEHMKHLNNIFDENIIYIPFQDDYVLKTLVHRSSGVLFPSFYEGFGLPVVEGFSQGVPVACSNVTSLPEVANGHAILFDPLDISDMADAIVRLSETNANCSELISYASNFTYEKAANKYIEIIDSQAIKR
jgi:glycosyltransferase involved in cell wall biosynthesis